MGLFDTFKKPKYVIASSEDGRLTPKALVDQAFCKDLGEQFCIEETTSTIKGIKLACLKVTSNGTFGSDNFAVILFKGDLIFIESDWLEAVKK